MRSRTGSCSTPRHVSAHVNSSERCCFASLVIFLAVKLRCDRTNQHDSACDATTTEILLSLLNAVYLKLSEENQLQIGDWLNHLLLAKRNDNDLPASHITSFH